MIKVLIDQEYYRELRDALANASESIWISLFEMESGRGARYRDSRGLVELVSRRAREGIETNVLLSQIFPNRWSDHKNLGSAWHLLEAGAEVKYLPGNRTVHAKVVVLDRRLAILGSHNWTRFSLGYNFEISIITDEDEVVVPILAELDLLFHRARHFQEIVRRPALHV